MKNKSDRNEEQGERNEDQGDTNEEQRENNEEQGWFEDVLDFEVKPNQPHLR